MDTTTPDQQDSNSPPTEKKKKTPKWLKALEAQSWQAELLISGVIIAGLLRLPKAFIQWGESYILESSELGYGFLSLAFIYAYAAICSLLIFFAVHFVLRAIWVALLGLNSVYPKGINVESTFGSGPAYWKKAKKDYPNLSAYNQELDKQCSTIFSSATFVSIMATGFAVVILLAYQVFRLSISIFPGLVDYVVHIGIALYVLFMVFTIGLTQLAKKRPDDKRVEGLMDKFGKATNTIFSLYFFRKPMGYIGAILSSNSTSKYGMIIFTVMCGWMGYIGGATVNTNPIYENFGATDYVTFNNQPAYFFDFNYDNLRKKEQHIFTPTIPSDVITGNVLKVFIPTIEREKDQMNFEERSFMQRLKGGRAFRDSLKQVNLQVYRDFNHIFINDEPYPQPDIRHYTHSNANEEGVLLHLPTDKFKNGKNILEVRKDYFSKKGKQKIVHIPFYFE